MKRLCNYLLLLEIVSFCVITAAHSDFDWNYYNSVNKQVINTNFDWEYYSKVNNLNYIASEREAHQHFNAIGKVHDFEYCKRFTIGILVHLYDLNLIEEVVERIDYFIEINKRNKFIVKINIPIGKNIDGGPFNSILPNSVQNPEAVLKSVLWATPYHKRLVTKNNVKKLYVLTEYLKNHIKLAQNAIQVIFSENRGLDIGGFFLLLDQLIKKKEKVDYIVKIHTKSTPHWRDRLMSILNLRVGKLLRLYEYIYTVAAPFDWQRPGCNARYLSELCDQFGISKKNFIFSGGTMFIVSYKMVEFFKKYNLLALFNTCRVFNVKPLDCHLEHAFERFFGCLGQHLNLKLLVPTYIKRGPDQILQ